MSVHERVSDERWAVIAPLLPPHPAQPKGGRPWLPDRPALCGILCVLKAGIDWNMLPLALGCGSGRSCWRRLRDWREAGVWPALHRALLDKLGEADEIDWSRVCVDGASLPAKGGARRPARTRPTAASPARSTTWRPTPRVSPSPPA